MKSLVVLFRICLTLSPIKFRIKSQQNNIDPYTQILIHTLKYWSIHSNIHPHTQIFIHTLKYKYFNVSWTVMQHVQQTKTYYWQKNTDQNWKSHFTNSLKFIDLSIALKRDNRKRLLYSRSGPSQSTSKA